MQSVLYINIERGPRFKIRDLRLGKDNRVASFFSSDAVINDYFNLIHHCISLGEAAGAAAAQAVNTGVDVRKVDIKALQTTLKKQGAVLPG